MSQNISNLSGRQGLSNNLFDRLGRIYRDNGDIKTTDLQDLAGEFLVGSSTIYSTASFYDLLREANRNKKVFICNGSACLCAGTQPSVKTELEKFFLPDEIGEMCCLGRCFENSAFHYQGKNYSGEAIHSMDQILKKGSSFKDRYAVTSIGKAVLTTPYPDWQMLYQPLLELLSSDPDQILEEIRVSGLRGRGGAGFPMAMKLEFCRKEAGDLKFIVCNADEGDPGAFSDRYLLDQHPHAVLSGMLTAGKVTGAQWGILYIRAEYPEAVESVLAAIADLEKAGLTGGNILGSGFSFHFKVIKAQGSYICGEETALINSIEGQRPEVRTRPPYPTRYGLYGKPTVVSNVETLACLPYILKYGGKHYASLGTERSTGTKLLSLDSRFLIPGIYEVEMGTPLQEVIDRAGGFRLPVKALHIGGPLGGLVPVSRIGDLMVDFESFQRQGFLLGHASMIAIPTNFPMIEYLRHLFEFAAHESCGKCFPCRLGTHRASEMLDQAIHQGYKLDRVLLDDLLFTLETGSLCAHGGGIPLPVRNALQYFEEELSPYFKSSKKTHENRIH